MQRLTRTLHSLLMPVPVVCFVFTLAADIAYWRTAVMQWANISAWLLDIGLLVWAAAAVMGLIEFFSHRGAAAPRVVSRHVLGNIAIAILSIWNALIHTRDAYTSVVPTGLILSTVTVALLLVTGLRRTEFP